MRKKIIIRTISTCLAIICAFQSIAFAANDNSIATSSSATDFLENITLIQSISEVNYNTDLNSQAIEEKYGLSVDDINNIAADTAIATTQNKTARMENQISRSVETSEPANALQFTLQCISKEDSWYSAQGTLNINGLSDSFTVQGRMYRTELENGNICFAGGLSGYLNDDVSSAENSITLSINYNYTTGERFVMASIGSCMMLNFGEPFDATTEIFNNVSEEIQDISAEVDAVVTSDSENTVADVQTTANGDMKLIATASGVWNGYSTTFVSIWGNNTAASGGVYSIRTKAQGRRPQFVAASKVGLKNTGDAYCIVDAIEHIFTNVWNVNNTNNLNVTVISCLPQECNKVFSFPLVINTPYTTANYVAGLFSFELKIKGVKHWIDDAFTKSVVRCWNTDLTCLNCNTGYSPYGEKNGFTSLAHYSKGASSCTFFARSEIECFYGSVRANGDVISTWKTVKSDTLSTKFT